MQKIARLRATLFAVSALIASASLAACKSNRQTITVFAASSLARSLGDFESQFEAENPKLDIQLEISGSQTACRKIAELNRRADVVLSADHRVIDAILRPKHARFTLRFATNELVIAHGAHSKHTERITADNWPSILLSPGVRLGMVNPDLAPIGYRTLLLWRLAGRMLGDKAPKGGLVQALRARAKPEHMQPHESQMLKLLQAQALDYAFVYRSTAEEHNLKTVRLPPTYNLGSTKHAAEYAKETVKVLMAKNQRKAIPGAAVVYGLTIPDNARNAAGAAVFVEGLLNGEGKRSLLRSGYGLISPPACDHPSALPATLRKLVETR